MEERHRGRCYNDLCYQKRIISTICLSQALSHPKMSVLKSTQQELSEKADKEPRRCCDWLLRFMQSNHPKFVTKAELREAALRELNVSKNSFDFA
jgi:hypothetical protein